MGFLEGYLTAIETVFEQFLIEYGLTMFISSQLVSGAGLLFFIPDALVTPTFTMFYAESFLEVFAIATISSIALTTGNFVLYLFSRFLGERYVSDDKLETRFWRFMNWSVNKNAPVSLVVLRWLPIGSGLVAIPAGLLDVKAKTFAAYSFIGFAVLEMTLAFGIWYGFELQVFEMAGEIAANHAPF